MKRTLLINAIVLVIMTIAVTVEAIDVSRGKSVVDTPHNLSVSGKGSSKHLGNPYQSKTEERVCVFCHSPHHAFSDGPLWSREIPPTTPYQYTPYDSTTLNAKNKRPDQPMGASRLCLSCHDGTIALGELTKSYKVDPMLPAISADSDPSKNIMIGRNLGDDHPISFPYYYEPGGELEDPTQLAAKGIKLSKENSLECTACHNPHDNTNGNFLVINNNPNENPGTPLCLACHKKAGWDSADASHRTGGVQDNINAQAISAQGCANCHIPHTAPGAVHLLKSAVPSESCMSPLSSGGSCHNGQKNDGDILSLFKKQYTHTVAGAPNNAHEEDEVVPNKVKHVECVDCHNPHKAGAEGFPLGSDSPLLPPAAKAPKINGPIRGVRGADISGTTENSPAQAEYQICFKCHASTNATFKKIIDHPLRQYEVFDQSQRFSSDNASYHPVLYTRKKNGESLLFSYRTSMKQIYCVDCHSPMGSDEPHMLKSRNYEVWPSSDIDYPLCFRCHDKEYLTNTTIGSHAPSAAFHNAHVFNHPGKNAACSTCHDPHGVQNNLFLVNFDTRATGPAPMYTGASCTVACHTSNPKNMSSY